MQYADTLTVVHHNDTRTEHTDVRYSLDRHGVVVDTKDGKLTYTEVLTTIATRNRT